MTLIKSISGIRGTIGGKPGEGLSPIDVVKFASAYAAFLLRRYRYGNRIVVVGRDARPSGTMIEHLVTGALCGMGFQIVDIGLATTPTVEIAVVGEKAMGGIIITASHNPVQWNALKLLNMYGEFLNQEEGEEVLRIAANEDFSFLPVEQIGKVEKKDYTQKHIDAILELPLVDCRAIAAANFSVAVDCINSVGAIAVPVLLNRLGVKYIYKLNDRADGQFAHNPEPIPEHLTGIATLVPQKAADVGFVVDPDVDRLAIVCQTGEMLGEENTLVAVADYVLQHTPGNTVSNLSSSRALADITHRYGKQYFAASVGEVNVVAKMKEVSAVIGGEGNGGVIYPALHYGRDALVGIALFLTYLAKSGKTVSQIKSELPQYAIAKQKLALEPSEDIDALLQNLKKHYSDFPINDIDGVRIDFPDSWVHLRRSNTEPIIRIYSEAHTVQQAIEKGKEVMDIARQQLG